MNDDDEIRNRMAMWLKNYIDISDCRYGYGNDKVIKQSICLLLKEGVFTREQLKRDALKKGEFILTDEFIDSCIK